jgi:solute carrier family 25 protein 39/40
MSAHWIRYADSDKELATAFEHQSGLGGRGHDRIHGDNPIPGVSSTIAMTGDMTGGNDDIEVDITAGQKMMSAMSGSLLTSLLGEWTVFR